MTDKLLFLLDNAPHYKLKSWVKKLKAIDPTITVDDYRNSQCLKELLMKYPDTVMNFIEKQIL
jgi:aspartate carbamoyltransferase regulatory subunit